MEVVSTHGCGLDLPKRVVVAQQLATIDFLDERLAEVGREIEARQRPCAEAVERLDAIPGVGRRTAEVLVSELGTDLSRFPGPRPRLLRPPRCR